MLPSVYYQVQQGNEQIDSKLALQFIQTYRFVAEEETTHLESNIIRSSKQRQQCILKSFVQDIESFLEIETGSS